MRRAPVVTGLVFGLAACASAPGGAASQPAWPSAIGLPRIATVGDLPPADATVVIALAADGRIEVAGAPVAGFTDLGAALAPCVTRIPGRVASPTNVLIAADAAVPWRSAAWTMQACADPRVGAPRIFFAVRHDADGRPGAFATFLPEDRGLMSAREVPVAVVRVRGGKGVEDPLALAAWLESRPDGARPVVQLDAAPDAPLAFLLRLADAAARGGAPALMFVGSPPPGPSSAALPTAAADAASRRWAFTVAAAKFPDPLPPMAVPPRVQGAFAGFALAEWPLLPAEEEKPESVEIVEDGAPK